MERKQRGRKGGRERERERGKKRDGGGGNSGGLCPVGGRNGESILDEGKGRVRARRSWRRRRGMTTKRRKRRWKRWR